MALSHNELPNSRIFGGVAVARIYSKNEKNAKCFTREPMHFIKIIKLIILRIKFVYRAITASMFSLWFCLDVNLLILKTFSF